MYMIYWKYTFLISFSIRLGGEVLGHGIPVSLTFEEQATSFP